jgi:hypothetical protein
MTFLLSMMDGSPLLKSEAKQNDRSLFSCLLTVMGSWHMPSVPLMNVEVLHAEAQEVRRWSSVPTLPQ